jgi:hypothetical protein
MRTFDLMCRDNRVVAVFDPTDDSVLAKHGDGVLPSPLLLTGQELWLRDISARNAIAALSLSPVELGLPEVKYEKPPEQTFEQKLARARRVLAVTGRQNMDRRFLKALAAESPIRVPRRLP